MAIPYADLIQPISGTKFAKLRNGQAHILRAYASAEHASSDIAVELPTGAGKTLIALLVLDYWRRQGHKVAILTGNKTLAKQVEAEAAALSVPTVRFEGSGSTFSAADLRSYRRAQTIGLMNYWVYVNQRPAVDRADYLVLDDAQLVEGALQSLFSFQVDRVKHKNLFMTLFERFAKSFESPVVEDVLKGIDDPLNTPSDLVCFSDFADLREEFEAIVEAYLESDEGKADIDLRFRWERNRGRIAESLCLISAYEIMLRPYVYPMQECDHLSGPTQRIYMSATIHDPGDLRRRIGSPPIRTIAIQPELSKSEEGRRLLVYNQVTSASSKGKYPPEVLQPLKDLLLQTGKSAWFCSSGSEAATWAQWVKTVFADASIKEPNTWMLSPTGDEYEVFRESESGHLFVAGRFEGMDFPDDVCRLAIFPTLPGAVGLLERFFADHLKDARFLRLRALERIKQGIGRCTRDGDDYSICYFLDPRFYAEMESPQFSSIVSERTRRQVELGLRLTENGMAQVLSLGARFIKGDFKEFDQLEAKVTLPRVLAPAPIAVNTVDDEVKGWTAMYANSDYKGASERFEQVVTTLGNAEREHKAFWRYNQAQADFLQDARDQRPGAATAVAEGLRTAIAEGGKSSWFNRLNRALNRIEKAKPTEGVEDFSRIFEVWDVLVERYPYRRGRFMKWQGNLKDRLDGTHDQAAEGLEVIGQLLGFKATRPSGDGATDVLWQMPDTAITIEVKVEMDRESVSLGDVNQAEGQRRAAQKELGLKEGTVDSLIVTPMGQIDPKAVSSLGRTRVLSMQLVDELRNRVETIMREYARVWTLEDAVARGQAREVASRSLPKSGWLGRATRASKGPSLTKEELFREWK